MREIGKQVFMILTALTILLCLTLVLGVLIRYRSELQTVNAEATLHGIGKAYKKGVESRFNFERVADLYADVRARLPWYFKNVTRTLDDEADYLQHYLEAKLPKGIIHGDLYPDNLLFKGQKIVGVLDFEGAGRGKFIFDMATAVNALCFDGNSYHLPLFVAFVAGYESLRTLALAEWDAFPNELGFLPSALP